MRTLWIIVGLVALALIVGLIVGATNNGGETVPVTDEMVIDEESRELTDGSYTLDTQRSTMRWTGRKTLIPGYEDSGTIGFTSGSAVIEAGTLVSGEFVVDMTTLEAVSVSNDMSRERLTGHLKSEDFFDVETYPTSRLVITDVTPVDEGGTTHRITGDLTIKANTQEVSFPATILQSGDELNAVGSVSVNRADFDVRFGSDTFFDNLGDNVIDDMFTLEFDLYASETVQE